MKYIGMFVAFLFVAALMAVVGAYPTKWLVNYLFTPTVLLAVFGTSQVGFWQALGLNFLIGSLFKSTTVNNK